MTDVERAALARRLDGWATWLVLLQAELHNANDRRDRTDTVNAIERLRDASIALRADAERLKQGTD